MPSNGGSAIISVDGTSWKVANSGDPRVVASGSVAGGVATGSDGTADFAAQKQ